jgi:hypothetical protein
MSAYQDYENGNDYRKSQPGDTEEMKKMSDLRKARELAKGTSMLLGDRRMKREKRDSRKMER